MPCMGLSKGPTTWSTWDFRGWGPWEDVRGLEDALVLVLKASKTDADKLLMLLRQFITH